MDNEIKVESVGTMPLSSVKEYFIPLLDYGDGCGGKSGNSWAPGTMCETELDAEGLIRNANHIKQARIIRVLLPVDKIN